MLRTFFVRTFEVMKSQEINKKKARFDTRLSQDQKQYFERAASIGGFRNLTDFIIVSAQEKAKEIITDQERIIASQKDSEIFFNAIINPREPSKTLREAAEEYKSLLK